MSDSIVPATAKKVKVFLSIDAREKRRGAQRITSTPSGNWFEHFLLRVIGFITVAFFIAFFTFYFCNWHINKSPSFPRGIYKMDTGYRPAIGDLVLFKPLHTKIFRDAENNGYLKPNDFLLKKLVAASGDVVTIDATGVMVNGQRLPNSQPKKFDGAGRPLQAAVLRDYRLVSGEVLLMSDYSPQSWDARYFGVQSEAGITGAARPVWLWE